MNYQENSFTSFDHMMAEETFSRWQGKTHESVDAYILRKRKTELYALVRKIIKDELNSQQQEIVRLHWYEGKSLSEIARILGIDKSTVSRKEKKINEIIYDRLKYAMEYRFGKSFSRDAAPIIKNNASACFPAESTSISQRLRNLRLRQGLNSADVTAATGITEGRLELIEKCGNRLTALELSLLAKLYGTTSDYIVFGIGHRDGVIQ